MSSKERRYVISENKAESIYHKFYNRLRFLTNESWVKKSEYPLSAQIPEELFLKQVSKG